jgi:hypothetical protein
MPIESISAAIAALTASWLAFGRPRVRRRREAKRASRARLAAWEGNVGDPSLGIMAVPSVPARLVSMEATLGRHEIMLNDLTTDMAFVVDIAKRSQPNGQNTNDSGDLIARIADKLGVLLPDDEASSAGE